MRKAWFRRTFRIATPVEISLTPIPDLGRLGRGVPATRFRRLKSLLRKTFGHCQLFYGGSIAPVLSWLVSAGVYAVDGHPAIHLRIESYSQPERLNPNQSPVQTTAITPRT